MRKQTQLIGLGAPLAEIRPNRYLCVSELESDSGGFNKELRDSSLRSSLSENPSF